jgi:uncharacterized integral membrane protein
MNETNDNEHRDEAVEEPTGEATYVEPGPGIPWRLTIFLALAVIVVVFAVQNTQAVELRFLGWTWQLPLVIIILVAVVVSILLDEIVGGMVKRRRLRRRRDTAELRRLRNDS